MQLNDKTIFFFTWEKQNGENCIYLKHKISLRMATLFKNMAESMKYESAFVFPPELESLKLPLFHYLNLKCFSIKFENITVFPWCLFSSKKASK